MTALVSARITVINDVLAERERQDAKWGEQNHPDGTGHSPEVTAAMAAVLATEAAAEGGYLDWLHILREEVAEAFAETDPVALRGELVQVAAVAVAWAEAIDRRTVGREPPVSDTEVLRLSWESINPHTAAAYEAEYGRGIWQRLDWTLLDDEWHDTSVEFTGDERIGQYRTLLRWAETREQPIRNVVLERGTRPEVAWQQVDR